MRHSLLFIALLTLFLTSCRAITSTEEVTSRCSAFAWEGERNDCFQELAIEECNDDHCALIENATLQASCTRAVERSCN
ncbi:MAG TPA: hypothetical protein VI913_03735 [Candidatus Peribacteraceae bacterium]|nr:hypothetical protein [Candidatus Peribacteraceae bacterium]